MQLFEQRQTLQEALHPLLKDKLSIGFVPTMGALHAGHLSLIKQAKKENDITVCSIFVNPTQFNKKKDLEKYPRTLEADIEHLNKVDCDFLFTPPVEEMYPVSREKSPTYDFGHLDKVMEGEFRPGHFKGVAIIVKKLFDIVQPDRAYFGEKDYQQLMIIKKLVMLLCYPIEIIGCPTVREKDGLAMSSRNKLLPEEKRALAPVIYKTLLKTKKEAKKLSIDELKDWVKEQINSNKSMKLEYFEIADAKTLMPVKNRKEANKIVACIAAYLGKVRLIDNIVF